MENFFEKGLLIPSYRKWKKFTEPKFKVFYNINDYIKEYSTTSAFSFKNYLKLFFSLFFIYFLLILFFAISLRKNKKIVDLKKYVNRFKRPIMAKLDQKAIAFEIEEQEKTVNAIKEEKEITN